RFGFASVLPVPRGPLPSDAQAAALTEPRPPHLASRPIGTMAASGGGPRDETVALREPTETEGSESFVRRRFVVAWFTGVALIGIGFSLQSRLWQNPEDLMPLWLLLGAAAAFAAV